MKCVSKTKRYMSSSPLNESWSCPNIEISKGSMLGPDPASDPRAGLSAENTPAELLMDRPELARDSSELRKKRREREKYRQVKRELRCLKSNWLRINDLMHYLMISHKWLCVHEMFWVMFSSSLWKSECKFLSSYANMRFIPNQLETL